MKIGLAANSGQRTSCLVLAFVAAGTFEVVRQATDWPLWCSVVKSAVTMVAFAALIWASRHVRLNEGHRSLAFGCSLAAFLLLPVAVETLIRFLTAEGEAFEIVMLSSLRNAALGTAAFAWRRKYARMSYLFSAFLTLFAVSISDSRIAFFPAALYAAVGLWSLMGAYWERMQSQFAVSCERRAPVRIGVLAAVCGVLAASVGLFAGTRRDLLVLPGLMPSSGGQQRSDPFARDGIGDGDMLAAAKNEAQTFGPVDAEQFLDSNMPSLYDMLDDRYGEPTVKPRNVRKAVALSGKTSSDRTQPPGQSKRSGREFTAARRKTQNRSIRPRDTVSKALLYVMGPVPVYLELETYDFFDGATWLHVSGTPPTPALHLDAASGQPWVEFSAAPRDCVLGEERHAVKIVNFQSPRFPSPPLLSALCIDRVNRLDMFAWTSDGVLAIEGHEHIPQFTVVHLVNHVLAADAIRKCSLQSSAATMSAYLALPDVPSIAKAKRIADVWTAGVSPGWPQVEAIVERLRTDFVHDNDAVAPERCEDVVGSFLARRRGPDYLFASTAAVLLRSRGYPTRLVSGFYVDSKRYDSRARQTAVVKDDAHVWLEVSVGGTMWVPVEPTPGYEPPRMVRTWRELAWTLLVGVGRWMTVHWIYSISWVLAASIAVWKWRQLADAIDCALWRGRSFGGSQRAVLATVWLMERRARLAGCSRPQGKTLAAWYGGWLLGSLPNASETDIQVALLIDWALYAPRRIDESPLSETEVRKLCRHVVRSVSLKTMRRAGRLSRSPSLARI